MSGKKHKLDCTHAAGTETGASHHDAQACRMKLALLDSQGCKQLHVLDVPNLHWIATKPAMVACS